MIYLFKNSAGIWKVYIKHIIFGYRNVEHNYLYNFICPFSYKLSSKCPVGTLIVYFMDIWRPFGKKLDKSFTEIVLFVI